MRCAVLLPYVGGLGLVAGHESGKFLDTQCNLQETPPPQRTVFYARDGKTVIATIFTQNRVPVPLSQIPTTLQQALIDTEDRRFYKHHGVDMRGLVRSAFNTSSGDTQGGSTLTMQYVKQVRYYQASEITDPAKQQAAQQAAIAQTGTRKMEDAQCAIEWEKHESKAQILDNYLNIAFFGENAYGIQVAAKTYFGKDVSQLSLPESAMLVGLLRAPSLYDPFQDAKAAKDRRNQVIQNMVSIGDISAAEAARYEAAPLSLATTQAPQQSSGCTAANTAIANSGFFCDYVEHWLATQNGITDIDTGGYRILTTLDATVQNSTQHGLAAQFPATSPMTAVMPVVQPKTGDILATAASKPSRVDAWPPAHGCHSARRRWRWRVARTPRRAGAQKVISRKMRTCSMACGVGTLALTRTTTNAASVEPSPAGTGTADPAAEPSINAISSAPLPSAGGGPGSIRVVATNAQPSSRVVAPEAASSAASERGWRARRRSGAHSGAQRPARPP